MNEKEARKRIQVIALFLNLHTMARNAKNYTPLDKDGKPTSEEMRRLSAYVREINRHNGRRILRGMMMEIRADEKKKKSRGSDHKKA